MDTFLKKYTDGDLLEYRNTMFETDEMGSFEKIDFSDNNLGNIDMNNVWITDCLFQNMTIQTFENTLYDAILKNCIFENCIFENIRIIKSDFTECEFQECSFTDCEIVLNDMWRNEFKNISLENCKVDFFSYCIVDNLTFKNSEIEYFEFLKSIISGNMTFENVQFKDERIGTSINVATLEAPQIITGEEALRHFVSKSSFKGCAFANKRLEELVMEKESVS